MNTKEYKFKVPDYSVMSLEQVISHFNKVSDKLIEAIKFESNESFPTQHQKVMSLMIFLHFIMKDFERRAPKLWKEVCESSKFDMALDNYLDNLNIRHGEYED